MLRQNDGFSFIELLLTLVIMGIVLGIAIPARAPRLELGRTMVEGRYSLTKEWRQYRITRKTHPDVDFEALRRVRFDFGTPEGNAPGTVVFLDDIGVW